MNKEKVLKIKPDILFPSPKITFIPIFNQLCVHDSIKVCTRQGKIIGNTQHTVLTWNLKTGLISRWKYTKEKFNLRRGFWHFSYLEYSNKKVCLSVKENDYLLSLPKVKVKNYQSGVTQIDLRGRGEDYPKLFKNLILTHLEGDAFSLHIVHNWNGKKVELENTKITKGFELLHFKRGVIYINTDLHPLLFDFINPNIKYR